MRLTTTAVTRAASIGAVLLLVSCRAAAPPYRTFATPEDAVKALIDAAKSKNLQDAVAIFGPEGKELADSSDPETARRNRQVFVVATGERWQLTDQPDGKKVLLVGNESWPFPVPLVKDGNAWRFDTAAGREEIIARRIGRNELATIKICRTYVFAQQLYAKSGHDGKPAGLFAKAIRSDSGKENGLYWVATHRRNNSPLGDLLAEASAADDRPAGSPFHGYYFKILAAQDRPALVAWPAEYDATGVMTFVVNLDGVVKQKDLGLQTDTIAKAMSTDTSDGSWEVVQ
jgi:Protein of unknown function (DUF2950)